MSSTLDIQDLGDRRQYIGGSDIGTILGLNKYKTPVQLYYEKRGEIEPFKGNESTKWGQILEAVIAAEYARREGVKVIRDRNKYQHPDHPYFLGHIDRRVLNFEGGKLLECKTAGKYADMREWGESGTDDIPASYMAQVQWYLMLTGWQTADLAALIAGQDFRVYHIARNETYIQQALDAALDFWNRIQEENPPPPMDENDCRLRWEIDSGETMIASEEIEKAALRLREIASQTKALEEEEKFLKTVVMSSMTDKSYLVDIAGNKLVSWKLQSSTRLDATLLKTDQPDLYKQYSKTSESRVFRLGK